jgi:hypothetical protein
MVKQVMFHISNFVKSQWFGSLLVGILLFYIIYSVTRQDALLMEKHKLENEIIALEALEKAHWESLDSLKSKESIIIRKEKTLIQLQHDTIRVIDTIAFSKLQQFFTDRYSKKDSIR